MLKVESANIIFLRTYRDCERDRVDQFQDEMEG